MAAGRPKKTKYNKKYMLNKMEEYFNRKKNDILIFKEVCIENDWNVEYVYALARDDEEISQAIRKIINMKEIQLEEGMLKGKWKERGAIFSLRQLGWSDNVNLKVDHKVTVFDQIAKEMFDDDEEDDDEETTPTVTD